jgi:hypothetical protein
MIVKTRHKPKDRTVKKSINKSIVTLVTIILVGIIALTVTATQQASLTDEEKIADAMSAGPASIAEDATIMDYPSEEGGEYRVLREGTNGWFCFPSSPRAVAAGMHNSFCDDEVWLEFDTAYDARREPQIERVGISYMLQGDAGVSNTDPFPAGPTEDNEWHVNGPHIMILLPDPSLYEGLPTDPHNGGPWVMWRGTPYQHLMLPVDPHPQE